VTRLPLAAAGLAAAAAIAVSGTWLWSLPDALDVRGPTPADWTAVAFLDGSRPPPQTEHAYPADGLATTCARGPDLEVCVYPAYGEAVAARVLADTRPAAALLAGLPGVPQRIRMVPSSTAPCQDAEVQLPESQVRWDSGFRVPGAYNLLDCGLQSGQPPPGALLSFSRPAAAVYDWALAMAGSSDRFILPDHDVQPAVVGGGDASDARTEAELQAADDATLAMLALPPAQVRAELAPLWERLRAGEVDLDELPGATR